MCCISSIGGREHSVAHALDGFHRERYCRATTDEALECRAVALGWNHTSQPTCARSSVHREAQGVARPRDVAERRSVAAIQPRQHLAGRDHWHAACLSRRNNSFGRIIGVAVAVGVQVGGERAVVALRSERLVEQRVDMEWVALPRLVGHLGCGLVHVDQCTIEVSKAHRDARAGEHARPVLNPGARPVVVVGVQADAVCQLDLWLCGPVAPGDAVGAMRALCCCTWEGVLKSGQLSGVIVGKPRWRPNPTACVDVNTELVALALECVDLAVADL